MKPFIKKVSSRRELKTFVKFPNRMYRNEKYYVPTLERGDMDALDRKKNHAFEVCEAEYWLALDPATGNPVGRIAGIINRAYNEKMNVRQARFGFMDFIDDNDVVDALFSTVSSWAGAKGMESLCGPLGFLEFDAAGVLVEGFDQLPTPYGKYNYPYYEKQMLRLGFSKDTDWIEIIVTVPDPLPDRYEKAAAIVAERYHLHTVPLKSKKQMVEYFDEMADLLNSTYGKLHGFSELTPGQIEDLKAQFVPNLSPEFVGIVQDSNDRIIGFGICMPSVAKALQKARGKLFPFGFIHILHAIRHNDTVDTLLIGIDDKYKRKGVNSMIFSAIAPAFHKYGIKYIETTRELEDNNNIQNIWKEFEHRTAKRARCYVKAI